MPVHPSPNVTRGKSRLAVDYGPLAPCTTSRSDAPSSSLTRAPMDLPSRFYKDLRWTSQVKRINSTRQTSQKEGRERRATAMNLKIYAHPLAAVEWGFLRNEIGATEINWRDEEVAVKSR
ncbi:hypothetical protein K0M31_015122 [Melipona bicolor]|uniref:Uncharacterized protein n=1 Tax=Melipona bicolor TaxID=60889 RepID=A0AA40FG81_9HYME|nr:hypothetical protein K0M31_015122 [Melipona bicolor]